MNNFFQIPGSFQHAINLDHITSYHAQSDGVFINWISGKGERLYNLTFDELHRAIQQHRRNLTTRANMMAPT